MDGHELAGSESVVMETVFGLLYPHSRSRESVDSLRQVACLLGAPVPAIVEADGFCLCLSRTIIDRKNQKNDIAISPERTIWLAMTGEIEGLGELIDELDRSGHEVPGETDADVLLKLFMLHGTAFVERVQGFFNIVIWDARRRRLFLYADRCGQVRPLYYHQGRNSFAFGSCVKAVIGHEHVPRRVDETALDEVLVLAQPIAPRTLFAGISVLTAGTFLEYSNGEAKVRRYWKRQPYRPSGEDLDTIGERYLNALDAAVRRSLDTTAETGILLSGGVDSAALVALLHRAGRRGLKTFSIHVGDPIQSDLEAPLTIADRYQTDHRCIEYRDGQCLDQFPDMIWHFETPGLDFHPTYLLCQEVRKYCDVVIGGHGNDLIWGIRAPSRPADLWLSRIAPAVGILGYLRCRRNLSRAALRKLRTNAARTDFGLLRGIARSARKTGHPVTDHICLDEALFGDQRVFLELGKFIVDAHNLWVRLPYSDASVVALAEAVPPDARYRKGSEGHLELKSFFKGLMCSHQILPAEVIYRPKRWMTSPTAEWLRGPLGEKVEAIVLSSSARRRGYFNLSHVATLIDQHRASVADHTYPLMMLAAIELWQRMFIDPPTLTRPKLDLSGYGETS
jgi:asparagine synthase (glutamine-hydrolysing)